PGRDLRVLDHRAGLEPAADDLVAEPAQDRLLARRGRREGVPRVLAHHETVTAMFDRRPTPGRGLVTPSSCRRTSPDDPWFARSAITVRRGRRCRAGAAGRRAAGSPRPGMRYGGPHARPGRTAGAAPRAR